MDFSKISFDGLADNKEWIFELSIKYGVKIVSAIGLLFIGWVFALWVKKSSQRVLSKTHLDITVTKFLSSIFQYVIIVMLLLSCLNLFGIRTTSIAALLGAAGLAIGLAFQGTLSNLAAGLMLLIFRPFKVGDYIEAAGEEGTVEEIQIFTTTFKNLGNIKIIVPNSNIFGSTIKNYTGFSLRRVDIPVGVAYEADLKKTRQTLEDAVKKVSLGLQDPPAQILLKSLGDSAIHWHVRVWCKSENYWPAHEETIYQVKTALDEAGISIPFPQMDVHLDQVTT